MELPITKKDLDTIINALRLGGNTALYQKLWTFKMNYMYEKEQEKLNGLS